MRKNLANRIALATFFVVCFLTSLGQAATYNVADGDVSGLIAAINASNANAGPDTINLAAGGIYTLTYVAGPDSFHGPSGLPIIQGPSESNPQSLTINGNGATIQRSSTPGTPEFRILSALYANLTLDSVVIRGGFSQVGGGAAYLNVSTVLLRNSTVTDNWAASYGGGIANNCGVLNIENSTISYNTIIGAGSGGGVISGNGCPSSVDISNSTLYENQSDGSGGFGGQGDGIAALSNANIRIKNSLVANPARGHGADCALVTPTSLGHNIFSDSTCGQNVSAGDLIVPNMPLGPLTDNGGATPTHALMAGSPAIDAVPVADCTNVTGTPILNDQRGALRPAGAACDIGSYEYNGRLDGLISYWPADGNTDDVVGPNNGSFQNGQVYEQGILGQAFSLDGQNRYITAPDSPSLSLTGALTLEAWIKISSNNRQQAIIEKYDVPAPNGYFLRITDGGKVQSSVCNAATCSQPPAIGVTTVSTGIWHHVAGVYDGTTIKVYLDGVLEGTSNTTFIPTNGAATLKIGARGDDANTRLGGLIDEVRIYNRALTAEEIAVAANVDSTPPVITPIISGTLGNNGWYTSDVQVDWTVADGESTVSSSTGCGQKTVTSDTAGVTFTCSATSGGGTASQSVTIKRDATAPVISNMPSDQTVEATGANGATVSWSQPSTADAMDPNPSQSCSLTSGSLFAFGTATVVCTAIDAAGNSSSASFTVTVRDTTPPVISNTPGNISLVATSASGASVTWASPTASDIVDGSTSVTCSPASGGTFAHGTTTVTCTAIDSHNNSSSSQFTVEVKNAPPTANAGGPYQVYEGGAVNLAGAGSDIDGAALAYEWDLDGNGTFETAGQNPTFSAAGLDGPTNRSVKLRVTDSAGSTAVSTAVVNVANVAPTLVSITGSVAPQAVNTMVNINVNYTDPAGSLDQYTISTNWGDGVTDSSTSHSYASAGVYRVKATIADDDGGVSNQGIYEYVVIYDPSAGFVTGGGWIMSPAGAYAADPSLSGKATFGFVSKYHRGATVPTGNTEFQFQAGDFRFKSDAYDWLVIAGARAQYKGTGSVNGVAGYSFLLTATDGQINGGGGVDKFRIKIWNAGGVVYDNVMGGSDQVNEANPQAIGGGSIIIQSER